MGYKPAAVVACEQRHLRALSSERAVCARLHVRAAEGPLCTPILQVRRLRPSAIASARSGRCLGSTPRAVERAGLAHFCTNLLISAKYTRTFSQLQFSASACVASAVGR